MPCSSPLRVQSSWQYFRDGSIGIHYYFVDWAKISLEIAIGHKYRLGERIFFNLDGQYFKFSGAKVWGKTLIQKRVVFAKLETGFFSIWGDAPYFVRQPVLSNPRAGFHLGTPFVCCSREKPGFSPLGGVSPPERGPWGFNFFPGDLAHKGENFSKGGKNGSNL